MITLSHIFKSFRGRQVLRDISFEFSEGLHCVKGKNGVGKSTLIKVIAGVCEPDSGEVLLDGINLRTRATVAKRKLAYIPDSCPVYDFLSGKQFLDLVAQVKCCSVGATSLRLLDRFLLLKHLNTKIKDLSFGTKRKLMIAAASIGDPSVIVADEPSNGLDEHSLALVTEFLRTVAENGVVVFTSHDENYIAQCDPMLVDLIDGALVSRVRNS